MVSVTLLIQFICYMLHNSSCFILNYIICNKTPCMLQLSCKILWRIWYIFVNWILVYYLIFNNPYHSYEISYHIYPELFSATNSNTMPKIENFASIENVSFFYHYPCTAVLEPCGSSPCLNGGVCIEQGSNYICSCSLGYQGDHCETGISLMTCLFSRLFQVC